MTTVPGTLVARLCGTAPFAGFHWCNYGLEPAYLDRLAAAGLVVAATAADAGVEAVELPGHPFYVATLFQPQVGKLAERDAASAHRGARAGGATPALTRLARAAATQHPRSLADLQGRMPDITRTDPAPTEDGELYAKSRSRLRLPLGGGERAHFGPDGRHVPCGRDRHGRSRPRASARPVWA